MITCRRPFESRIFRWIAFRNHSTDMKANRAPIFLLFFTASLLLQAHQGEYKDQDCLICHGEPNIHQILSDGKTRSLYVNPDEWDADVHHRGRMTCVDCHVNADPAFHFREGQIDVDCAQCHRQEEEEYLKNVHFDYQPVLPGRELPQCYHCHTRHHILRYDDPASSIHEKNIGATCVECHPEVMVEGILKGTSLGKISGHRKGDLSEKFDMMVCTSCHYQDSAHGAKRVVDDFCSRCHDVNADTGPVMGPTHLNSMKWTAFNYTAAGLVFILVIGAGVFWGYKKHACVFQHILLWHKNMRIPMNSEKRKNAEDEAREPQAENHE